MTEKSVVELLDPPELEPEDAFDEIDAQLGTEELFDQSTARPFDRLGFTPNQLTMWRVYLSAPMCLSFWLAEFTRLPDRFSGMFYLMGIEIYIIAALCDLVDGKLARYQMDRYNIVPLSEAEEEALPFFARVKLRGSTFFGKVADPFADKVLNVSTYFLLGWHIVHPALLFGSLVVALLLTALRLKFVKRFLELGGEGSSNLIGRIKIGAEVVAIAVLGLMPSDPYFGDLRPKFWLTNIAVGVALMFSIGSFAGHLKLGFKKFARERRAKQLAKQRLSPSILSTRTPR